MNITQLTLDLIDGQLKTDASSPIDYWNIDSTYVENYH
jgi:hypothetical protein